MRCLRVFRSETGILEADFTDSKSPRAGQWEEACRHAERVERIESLAGWGIYTGLYRVDFGFGPKLYMVEEEG